MRRQGFSREERILSADDFASVKAKGVRARSGPFLVSAVRGDRARLGVVVGKKVGNAVERNRIKRVVRELFRTERELFPLGDCVVVPHEGASDLENKTIKSHLRKCLAKVNGRLG